jgi:hypothetical protein
MEQKYCEAVREPNISPRLSIFSQNYQTKLLYLLTLLTAKPDLKDITAHRFEQLQTKVKLYL